MDDVQALHRARDAAQAFERAAADLVEFAERLPNPPGPAEMVEYTALVAREAAAQSARKDAFRQVGLAAPSIEGGTAGT